MDSVTAAFAAIPRQNFLPKTERSAADLDIPLPIGYGQTNSQPLTVRLMLEWLAVEPGQKVLDVGSGSGWTTALLAHLTGASGHVVAVEKIPELVVFGRNNCARLGIRNVTFHETGARLGWSEEAPYDRILVSAAASELPEELVSQLARQGRMVIPVGSHIFVVNKDNKGQVTHDSHSGFAFVPLVTS